MYFNPNMKSIYTEYTHYPNTHSDVVYLVNSQYLLLFLIKWGYWFRVHTRERIHIAQDCNVESYLNTCLVSAFIRFNCCNLCATLPAPQSAPSLLYYMTRISEAQVLVLNWNCVDIARVYMHTESLEMDKCVRMRSSYASADFTHTQTHSRIKQYSV